MKRTTVNLIIYLIFAEITIFSTEGSSYAGIWGDDFNDGNLDGWTKAEKDNPAVATWTWKAKDGVLDVTVLIPRPNTFTKSLLELTAFPIEVERLRVKLAILTSLSARIGILIGKQPDWGGKQRFAYNFSNRWIDGPIALPKQNPDVRYEIQKIEVIFEKGHFRLLSMGEQIAEFKDDNFGTANLIAISATAGVPTFHAVLDNFVISGPGIPDGPSFPVSPKGKLAISWGELKDHR